MRTCTRCDRDKPLTDFNWRSRAKGTYQSACKVCQGEINKSHYRQNPAPYRERAQQNVAALKTRFVEWLRTQRCKDCGEDDPIVLDCDHVRGKKYPGGINRMLLNGFSWEKLEEEIAKCEVRCANCHRRKTARQFGWVYRV